MRKKRFLFFWIFMGVLVGALALAILIAQSYLNSARFQKQVFFPQLERQLECHVEADQTYIRLWRGVDMVSIRLSRPDVTPHEYLQANRLKVRYDLWEALSHQKIVLEQVKLSEPRIQLNLGAAPAAPSESPPPHEAGPAPEAPPPAATEPPAPDTSILPVPPHAPPPSMQAHVRKVDELWPPPPKLDLRSVIIEDGSLDFTLPNGDKIVLAGANTYGALGIDPVPTGAGTITCQSASLPWNLKFNESKLSFLWRKDNITIPKFTAQLFGGTMEGNYKIDQTRPGGPFEGQVLLVNLNMEEVYRALVQYALAQHGDLHGLMLPAAVLNLMAHDKEAEFRGGLQLQARFDGSVLAPNGITGQGQFRIANGRLVEFPGLVEVSHSLDQATMRNLPIQKCEVDFILEAGKFFSPRYELLTPEFRMWGRAMQHETECHFAISAALAHKLAPKELEGLTAQADGFMEVPSERWDALAQHVIIRSAAATAFDRIYDSVK